MTDDDETVFAADEQTDVPVDIVHWTRFARFVLDEESRLVPAGSELGLLFVDEAAIADLNERFLGHPGPTDVLAFPLDADDYRGGRFPDEGGRGPGVLADPGEPPVLLGDVVVCPAVAGRQAAERGVPVADEIALLIVHGILHLLSYDHAEPTEATEMERRQQEILGRFRAAEERG